MNCSTSANSTISSNLRCDLAPLHAEDRAVQEDVLAAGQLGVEAGADLEQAARRGPRISARPSVGVVMRERIFSSVDLPAPLRPMTPSTSPSRDLERDVAERPDLLVIVVARLAAETPARALHDRVAQRSVAAPGARRCGTASRARRRGSRRHQIVSAKRGSERAEVQPARRRRARARPRRRAPLCPSRRRRAEDRPAQAGDHRRHRVEREDPLPLLRDRARPRTARPREEPDLEEDGIT